MRTSSQRRSERARRNARCDKRSKALPTVRQNSDSLLPDSEFPSDSIDCELPPQPAQAIYSLLDTPTFSNSKHPSPSAESIREMQDLIDRIRARDENIASQRVKKIGGARDRLHEKVRRQSETYVYTLFSC